MSSSTSTDKSRTYSSASSFNITVLISGSGTNLQALIDACQSTSSNPTLSHTKITHVISNRREAYGLTRAKSVDIPTSYHNLVAYKKRHASTEEGIRQAREQYDADLAQIILTHIPSPDLVVCAGWMHIFSSPFIESLNKANVPVINLHPALPGQFNGADAIARAWDAFQKGDIACTGVMVHHVIGEVDMGEPVVVEEVNIRHGESESDLEARIHEIEWRVIVSATAKVLNQLEEKRKVEGRD